MITLLREIDLPKTSSRVKKFFKEEFPRISRLAGINPSFLKSPFIDDMPKASAYKNIMEETLIENASRRINYENVLLAIQRCSFISQQIIIYDFVQNYSNEYVADMIKYGNTAYKIFKKKAAAEFADTYEAITGEDLHVYKK